MRFAIKHLLRAAIIALVVVAPLIGYISVGYLSPTGVVVTAAESIKPPEAPQHHVSIWSHIKNGVRRVLDSVGVDAEAIKLYAKWVVGAPILVMGVLIALLLRPTRKPRDKAPGDGPTQHSIDKASDDAPVRIESKPAKPNVAKPRASIQSHPKPSVKLSSKQQVLRFFLNLYKNKQGADPEAPVQLVRTETRPVCPDETYEMRLMHKEEWVTRRMSIGLLGQGGGSRSQCYYVIYDSHMVIKIPSVPMTKFTEYRRQIAAEGRILSRLSPRECIVPRVSVILTAFLTFPGNQQLSEEALEARYMRHLENNPDFQEHLKIGDSFAFFMDLAKHLFLSTTLEEIHSDKGRLLDEARQHPDLLWDQHAFVCRYGEEAGGVCQSLQEAYFRCEAELRRLAETAGMENSISTYHLKQWFLTHIVGEKLRREEFDLPVNVIEKVNAALAEVVKDNSHAAKRYRRQLHDYVRDTRFSQHRRQFEGLASNMLDLLAWIRQKGLAMRDLKPENLFVAGNPEEYPVFLNTPEKFSIGLIDVETAVPIDAEDPILIPQPQLAGTPLYATPAHLMSNAILMEVYEDLAAILHLQDWFATIGIIYKIISGENLFGTTAHVFPDILS
ncbi:MAG: hypothetical protein HKP58_12855, partial [Desulfatitalea sp.]|nr:hypothetical protein [Desulfatitalea sp.]